jgi:hypothetical protein
VFPSFGLFYLPFSLLLLSSRRKQVVHVILTPTAEGKLLYRLFLDGCCVLVLKNLGVCLFLVFDMIVVLLLLYYLFCVSVFLYM